MKFRAKNCRLIIHLEPSLRSFNDQYKSFTKIGDEFVCDVKSDLTKEGIEIVHLELPANLGARVFLEQVELSITDTSGSIQLDLDSSEALFVNLSGNVSVQAEDSKIRIIGGDGELNADMVSCSLTGVLIFSQVSVSAKSSNLELSSRKGSDAIWSFYGDNNRILFDPKMKPNLMVNSIQDNWVHSGLSPEIFVNIFGKQKKLGFVSAEVSYSDDDANNLEVQDFLTESLETVESNDDLMDMFDYYEDQINIQLDELSESADMKVDGEIESKAVKTSHINDAGQSKSSINTHQKQIMSLHLEGKIDLSEMELMLKDLEDKKGK